MTSAFDFRFASYRGDGLGDGFDGAGILPVNAPKKKQAPRISNNGMPTISSPKKLTS